MNVVKNKLEENWEYVGYDLLYRKFKAQVNVCIKNKKHGLKFLNEASAARRTHCLEEHWEGMKRLMLWRQNKRRQPRIVL